MIALGTRTLWEQTRRPVDVEGATFYKGEWMISGDDPLLSPTVFLAEQPPNHSLLTHFHKENQFQLFVEGAGSLGPIDVRPVTVHYAGAYTGYGPLLSGEDGLKYFTIRAAFDTGYVPLSRARAEMIRGPKVHAHSSPQALCSPQELANLSTSKNEVLIPATEDGMGAMLTSLPPSALYEPAHLRASVGMFVFVVNGTCEHGQDTLAKWDSLFLANGESADLRAGPSGAQIVALSMPPKNEAYRNAGKGRQ